jgi:hypothetical protein
MAKYFCLDCCRFTESREIHDCTSTKQEPIIKIKTEQKLETEIEKNLRDIVKELREIKTTISNK